MEGSCQRIDESLVGVGREIDGDVCSGGDRARDLDVESDLAVGTVGVAWRVGAAVDGDRRDLRFNDAELAEIGAQVAGVVAAAEFDDADGLSLAVDPGREAVELGHLGRIEGAGLGRSRLLLFLMVVEAEVGLRDGVVVESEDGLDRFGVLLGYRDGAGVAVVSFAFVFVVVEGDAECLLDFVDGAAHHHGAPRQAGCAFVDGQAVLVSKFAQLVEAGGVGGILLREFLLADMPAAQFFED